MRRSALLVAVLLAAGVAPAGRAAPKPWTNDHLMLVVTAGPDGASGVAVDSGGLRRRTGEGPSVFAVGAGRANGGGMLATEGGGGPLEITTTGGAAGARVTLAASPLNAGEGAFGTTLSVERMVPRETVVGIAVLGNTVFQHLPKPRTVVREGSVTVRLVQLSGTRVIRVGDPTADGVAADVVTAGGGVQRMTSRLRTPVAGAFVTGGLNVSTAAYRAPDGSNGRWASGVATGVGALSFAGPAGTWSFDWEGADAVLGGSPVAWFTTPVGRYWRFFRCRSCVADPLTDRSGPALAGT